MRKLAALDVGTVRIGVAVSDPETRLAMPYCTVHVKEHRDPCAYIAQLLSDLGITHIVVGWPLELDGSQGPAVRRTKQFLHKLKSSMPSLKIAVQDERLSSSAAEQALQICETQGSKKKSLVDAMAAAIILQTYIDKH